MRTSDTDTDPLRVLTPERSAVDPGEHPASVDRRALHGARRRARHVRRLYALAGLAVLAGAFAAAVVVVMAR
ncbi:MAG: hypothetical protein M0Z46_03990 [Actinomycetota bacterium]|jgi:hypothetical protein|nr:hypothetical protein [Actinomycetota bacterium]